MTVQDCARAALYGLCPHPEMDFTCLGIDNQKREIEGFGSKGSNSLEMLS